MAVKLLPGLVDYRCALDLQTRIVARKADMASATTGASATAGAWPDVLLLLQHPPTYTAGRRIRGADATEGARLRRLGAAYLEVGRG